METSTLQKPIPRFPWRTAVALAFLLAVVSPWAWTAWIVSKAHQDVQSARTQFQSTVDPDVLRAWVRQQLEKHPQGGYAKGLEKELPPTFPKFPGSRFSAYFYPSSEKQNAAVTRGASLVWEFRAGEALKVTVWLNADGSAADFDDISWWARGITFDHLHR